MEFGLEGDARARVFLFLFFFPFFLSLQSPIPAPAKEKEEAIKKEKCGGGGGGGGGGGAAAPRRSLREGCASKKARLHRGVRGLGLERFARARARAHLRSRQSSKRGGGGLRDIGQSIRHVNELAKTGRSKKWLAFRISRYFASLWLYHRQFYGAIGFSIFFQIPFFHVFCRTPQNASFTVE